MTVFTRLLWIRAERPHTSSTRLEKQVPEKLRLAAKERSVMTFSLSRLQTIKQAYFPYILFKSQFNETFFTFKKYLLSETSSCDIYIAFFPMAYYLYING
jgi:hypothetical protein